MLFKTSFFSKKKTCKKSYIYASASFESQERDGPSYHVSLSGDMSEENLIVKVFKFCTNSGSRSQILEGHTSVCLQSPQVLKKYLLPFYCLILVSCEKVLLTSHKNKQVLPPTLSHYSFHPSPQIQLSIHHTGSMR